MRIDFSEATPVLVHYRGTKYNCDLSFNGNVLCLKACNPERGVSVDFIVDTLTCTIISEGLEKVYETEKLSKDFLPKKLFAFFNSNGVVLELKPNKNTGEAYFDSIADEPYVYVDSDNNIIFQIK